MQHSGNLVVERREEQPVASQNPVTMNAFELISTSQGLNLSTLFEKQMVRLSSSFFLFVFFMVYFKFLCLAFWEGYMQGWEYQQCATI